jgi:PAS domain S-box-containing protein
LDVSDLLPKALLSTRGDAIVAADGDGIIRFWNPGAERIFGHAIADAIGHSLDLIIPERLRQRHWAGYGRAIRSNSRSLR